MPERDGFVRQLEVQLNVERAPQRYAVINAGIPGYGVWQQAALLEKLRGMMRVDAVISTFSLANDPVDDLRLARYVPDRLLEANPALRDPHGWLTRLVRTSRLLTLLDVKTEPLQFALANTGRAALAQADTSLAQLAATCRVAEIPLLVAMVPRRNEILQPGGLGGWITKRLMAQPRQLVTAAAQRAGLPLVDLTPALAQLHAQGTQTYLTADAHWTPAGHTVVADTLLASIPRDWGYPPPANH
jgi:hypothetical protein